MIILKHWKYSLIHGKKCKQMKDLARFFLSVYFEKQSTFNLILWKNKTPPAFLKMVPLTEPYRQVVLIADKIAI